MQRNLAIMVAACLCFAWPLAAGQERSDKLGHSDKVAQGRQAVRGRPAMNPAVWRLAAYDDAWKQWGVKEKPADYRAAFLERYGLHAAPYENDGLPMGLHTTKGLLGKGLVNDCLLCHAGSVAGQTYIGLGNASLDLQ